MTQRARWVRAVGGRIVFLCALVAVSGCQDLPTGPSLKDFQVSGVAGSPTIANSPNLCCCHVVGTATNRTTVPLHATIQFTGFDVRGQELSTILYFIQDMAPGASHSIDAPGFIVPCSAISRYTWEVKVRGITYPPL